MSEVLGARILGAAAGNVTTPESHFPDVDGVSDLTSPVFLLMLVPWFKFMGGLLAWCVVVELAAVVDVVVAVVVVVEGEGSVSLFGTLMSAVLSLALFCFMSIPSLLPDVLVPGFGSELVRFFFSSRL